MGWALPPQSGRGPARENRVPLFRRAAFITPHLTALGLSFFWYDTRQDDPRVFFYAYILTSLLELFALAAFLRIHAGAPGWLQELLERITRRPAGGEVSQPVMVEGGGAAGLGGLSFAFGVVIFFGFILANVNSAKELDVTWPQFSAELAGALPLCLLYLLETFWGRGIVVDFQAGPEVNYGYNSSQLTFLALAVLASGALMVVVQDRLDHSTGWVVLGPLLFFRHGILILQGLLAPVARLAGTAGESD